MNPENHNETSTTPSATVQELALAELLFNADNEQVCVTCNAPLGRERCTHAEARACRTELDAVF